MKKPVAYYEVTLGDPQLDRGVQVFNVIHPILGKQRIAHTSDVVEITENGFETQNTVYLKMKQAY